MKLKNIFFISIVLFSILTGCKDPDVIYRNSYTVQFNANGGSGEMESATYGQFVASPLPVCQFTPPNPDQQFYGWSLKSTSKDIVYRDAETITVSKNLTLFAVWGAKAFYTIIEKGENIPLMIPGENEPVQSGSEQVCVLFANRTDAGGTYKIDDVPFVEMEQAALLLANNEKVNGVQTYTSRYEGNKYIINRRFTNRRGLSVNATMVFDFDSQTVYCDDYDGFVIQIESKGSLDVTGCLKDSDNNYILLDEISVVDTKGKPVTFDCAKYNIPMIKQNGKLYIPFALLNSLLLEQRYRPVFYCNGKLFMYFANTNYKNSGFTYPAAPQSRSVALKELNYNLFCFKIDYFYGLFKEHIQDSTDYLCRNQTNLYSLFMSDNPKDASKAVYEFCNSVAADEHTIMTNYSPYSGNNTETTEYVTRNSKSYLSVSSFSEYITKIYLSRFYKYTEEEYSSNGFTYKIDTSSYNPFIFKSTYVPTGEERSFSSFLVVDKYQGTEKVSGASVAYLTFNNFATYSSDDLNPKNYKNNIDKFITDLEGINKIQNTFNLLIYAQNKIRSNPDIKTVVIDLSCNTGGSCNAAALMVAWALGKSAFNVSSSLTGAKCEKCYMVDLNMDYKFGKTEDVLSDDVKVYCLISGASFSSSNYVAAQFKGSGKVTLIGEHSSGGVCVVDYITTADGNTFGMSCRNSMDKLINGVNTSTDTGIAPDISLAKMENMFNRAKFAEYLDNLK